MKTIRHHECSSSTVRGSAQAVASNSPAEVRKQLGYSICVLIHSCKMPKENEPTGLNDGRNLWLVGNATDVGISDNVVSANVQDSS